MSKTVQTAIFGGGCFWCTETIFKHLRGIKSVVSGYAGGTVENPTYEQVSSGKTGHAEVTKIEFDPKIIAYPKLLEIFFAFHDPTTLNRQGGDVGSQYRSIILFTSPDQEIQARNYIKKLEDQKIYADKIVTEVKPLNKFFEAEESHQNYYDNNPLLPYCQVVISPKLAKIREKYAKLLK